MERTMTTLYRIEDASGHGICSVTGSKVCLAYRMCAIQHKQLENEHCYFAEEEEETNYLTCIEHWQYAFPSLKKLTDWFPCKEARGKMKGLNVSVVEYETEDRVISNGFQSLFDKSKAVKTGKQFDVETLRELETLKALEDMEENEMK